MKKYIVAVLLGALMTVCLAACASQPASSSASASGSASASASSAAASSAAASSAAASSAAASSASASAAAQPTEAELAKLIVDEKAKTVTVWGQVNGKYFAEETHHFLVNKDGSNGEKAILRAWAQPADFHAALEKIGGKPGNNLTMDNAKGNFVEGSKINITVTWDGAKGDVPFADCIKTKDGSPYKTDVRFGGNLEASNDKKTGCLDCTFSCPVGICSNAAYAYGTDDVFGNPDVLPADGTFVKVTFALAD